MSEPTMTELAKTLAVAAEALAQAVARAAEAQREEDLARQHCTDARNRLNAAQRNFDKAVDAIRGMAPGGSEWGEKKRVLLEKRNDD